MRLLPRRALMAFGLAISFVVAAAVPAGAYTVTWPVSTRNHTGVSLWTPRSVDFNSGWDDANNNAWMVFGFDWYQTQHKQEVTKGVTVEINAEVDCAWVQEYFTPTHQGYRPQGFDTNIPASSLAMPYEDTIFNDHCVANPLSGRGWVGVGVLNAQTLAPGHYYIRVASDTAAGRSNPHYNSVVALRTKVGVVYPGNVPAYGSDCTFSDSEIGTYWNLPTEVGLAYRMKATWCSWIDWSHYVVRGDGTLYTGQYQQFGVDKLYNQGMGDGGVGANGYGFDTGNNRAIYCNLPDAFDGNCILQFNRGSSSGASVYQDISMPVAADSYTAETAVRCRKGFGQTCDFRLAEWGLGLNPNEVFVTYNNVPDDGHWYVCRTDLNHGGGYFAYTHNTLRWQLFNDSTANMDVDYTFAGGKSEHQNPDAGSVGVGNTSVGANCTMK